MSGTHTQCAASLLLEQTTQFISHEARLLDEQQFEAWLALFDPAGRYWVPAAWDQVSPLDHVSIYYENVDMLRVRIMRLRHPRTETMRPPPRTVRAVTNVVVGACEGDEIEARAAYSTVEYRLGEQRLFAGICRYRLRRDGESFRILLKRVDLLNCDADVGHVRFTVPF